MENSNYYHRFILSVSMLLGFVTMQQEFICSPTVVASLLIHSHMAKSMVNMPCEHLCFVNGDDRFIASNNHILTVHSWPDASQHWPNTKALPKLYLVCLAISVKLISITSMLNSPCGASSRQQHRLDGNKTWNLPVQCQSRWRDTKYSELTLLG